MGVELTDLEETVYGVAANDVHMLFLNNGVGMSARILRVAASFKDSTALTNPEAIAAWRAGMEAEFSEVDWPEDYSEPPTKKSEITRQLLDRLEAEGVVQEDLDLVEELMSTIDIPIPEDEE